MTRLLRSALRASVVMLALAALARPAAAAPEGTLTWAVHISLAPTFFDPAETPGLITPFKIQQMATERVMFIPVMETAFLNGVGSRAEVHGLNLIPGFAYSAPYEDLKVRKK